MPLLGQDERVRQRVASARRAEHGAVRGQRQDGSPAGQRQRGSPAGKPRRRSAHGTHRVLVERSGRTSTGEFVTEIHGAQLVAQHIAGGRHGETLEHRLVNMEGALREQQGMLAESHHRILALLKENESLRVENQKLRSNHSEPPEVLHLRAAVDGLHRRNEDLQRALLSARRSAGTVAVATSAEKAAAVEYLVDADEETAKVAMAMSRGRAAALKLADETDSPGHGSLPHGVAAERGTAAAQTIVEKHAPHLAATPPQQLRLRDGTKASSTQPDGSSDSAVFQAGGAGNELGGKEAREAIAAALAAGERNANAVLNEDLEETAQKELLAEAERKQAVAAAAEMRVQLAKEEAQATVELYQAAAAAATAASAAEVERQKEEALKRAQDQQYERMLERKQVATEELQREGGSTDLQSTTLDLHGMGNPKIVAWDSNELQPEPELQSEPQLEPGSHVSGSHKPSPPQSHNNAHQNPNRRRLRQHHRDSFKPVEHDEAWSVSTAAVERPGSARRPSTVTGSKSGSERVRPGGLAAQSVYGSPRSAGGVAVAKKDATGAYQVEDVPETHVSATIEVANRASALHSRVQREIWRKEREVDLSGLRAAEQEHEEAEQRIREEEIGAEGQSNETEQAERSFGERLLWAETGWRRPVSAAAASHGERVNTGARTPGAIDDGAKERSGRKGSLSEVDPAVAEGGALLRLLRETPPQSMAAGYRNITADPGPCTDADSSVASLANATRSSGSRPPRKTQRPQTARIRQKQNAAGRNGLQRGGGRDGGKEQGGGPTAAPTGESHPWSARNLDRARHRPRTAPAPNAARRSGSAAGSRTGQRKPSGNNVVGLMLLGPQRVRIADASASMLESIERTATVLERAGRRVQANHAEPQISWQHHTVGDAAIEEEGQLGEVYRLV